MGHNRTEIEINNISGNNIFHLNDERDHIFIYFLNTLFNQYSSLITISNFKFLERSNFYVIFLSSAWHTFLKNWSQARILKKSISSRV